MTGKIGWVDNLRAVACVMVVLIHSTTYYITAGGAPGDSHWDVANILNSASRVCVPLFFMISGYLFFGERSARKKHFLRIGLCILFYSAVTLIYIVIFTPINPLNAARQFLQKPIFYHLWFFYAIVAIYLFSPLINVKPVSGRYLAIFIVLLAVVANPNTGRVEFSGVKLLPVNLYIYGDTFYYLLYAVVGRALGMLDIPRRVALAALPVFILCVLLVAMGTRHHTLLNDNFNQTFYLYGGPLVFLAAVSLFTVFKSYLNQQALPGLALISRHSLAIYGFHALIIHYLRTHGMDMPSRPVLDIFYIFGAALLGGLLLSMALQSIDSRRLVS
ncbi:acetyltransferase [Brenneria goodwinii]|uniref:O-acetyltransferase WecH n=1 Tax=Brenneria goodwinii TaxID=1109412 RepID=A0AAE8JN07_9GAMM|nr:acyltransferase [Brenneria goodwinii]ATA26083.1 acetyltransferase [Brenneria goodwinii]MCG8158789.1 acyltransferase [Brenneria goodwinii]MCG8163408.1 acyltransferase [Brenneria goodwinii]MCG8167918.1 acyltransferase [Brenneria goodwinii]MCG8172559.1 acyltransferase [Brenneria goodwinii]